MIPLSAHQANERLLKGLKMAQDNLTLDLPQSKLSTVIEVLISSSCGSFRCPEVGTMIKKHKDLGRSLVPTPYITGTAILLAAMIFGSQYFAVRHVSHASLLAKLPKEKVISGLAVFSLSPVIPATPQFQFLSVCLSASG